MRIVNYEKTHSGGLSETSETIRQQVNIVQDIQNKRFSNIKASDIVSNADMRIGEDQAFFSVAGRRSESNMGGDESAQFIGACLLLYSQINSRDCIVGRE